MDELQLKCRRCGTVIQVTEADQIIGDLNCPKCGFNAQLAEESSFPLGQLMAALLLAIPLFGVVFWVVLRLNDQEINFNAEEKAPSLAVEKVPEPEPPLDRSLNNQLRTIAIAMMVHAESDRQRRFLPQSAESWRIALAEATNQYEPNQLGGDNGKTRILLVTGPGTLFDAEVRNAGSSKTVELAQRPASTIPLAIHVGADKAVPVAEPTDFVLNPSDPKAALGEVDDPFLVVMADGSVHSFPANISPIALTVLCQIEPQLDAEEISSVEPELQRLGLPTVFHKPRRDKQQLEKKLE